MFDTQLTFSTFCRRVLINAGANNVAPPQKALGTIKDAIRPFRVRFSAYKGKNVFKVVSLILQVLVATSVFSAVFFSILALFRTSTIHWSISDP